MAMFSKEMHMINLKYLILVIHIRISKVGERSRGWPEDSLFDSFNTKV